MRTLACILAFCATATAVAQEGPAGATAEHRWLKQFVGEWETVSEASFGPELPPITCKGEASYRMLGELWLVSELKSEMMGTPIDAIQTLGYDPEKEKYVGTWIDTMMNHMWKYEGVVDESGKKLTLEAEGPNFAAGGKMTKFRDAYEFKSPDHVEAVSQMLGEDGEWTTFMTGDFRRKK